MVLSAQNVSEMDKEKATGTFVSYHILLRQQQAYYTGY